MSEIPTAVQQNIQQLRQLQYQLENVDGLLDELKELDYNDLISSLSSLEAAKADIALAFTLATLCFVRMNSHGQDISKHLIQEDLSRIKSFVAIIRAKELQAVSSEQIHEIPSNTEHQSKRSRVDVDAAGRMIRHGLSS